MSRKSSKPEKERRRIEEVELRDPTAQAAVTFLMRPYDPPLGTSISAKRASKTTSISS
jgi:hypothetical protein